MTNRMDPQENKVQMQTIWFVSTKDRFRHVRMNACSVYKTG